MTIAALVVWICTVGIGGYLLVTSVRSADSAQASQPADSEPPPFMRALAEFAHPALAITGLAFWLGCVVSHDRLLIMIGLGVLLAAIGSGLSWFAANARAVRRAAAASPAQDSGPAPLSVSARLLTLHAVGAALTLLLVSLVAARA